MWCWPARASRTCSSPAARPKDLDDAEAVIRARGPRLDVERIRSTLLLLEAALDRRDLLSELERLLGRTGRV